MWPSTGSPEQNQFSVLHTNIGASSNQKYDVDECSAWSKVFEEAEELLLHENANHSSSHFRSLTTDSFQKGSKRKSKLRFSFHQSSCKEANSPLDRKSGNAIPSGDPNYQSGLERLGKSSAPHSIAELLEGFGEQNDSLQPSDPSSLTRRSHLLGKGSLDASVYGLKQNGYVPLPEILDDGISSEEEGAQPVNQCAPTSFFDITTTKEKTMADHFMEIFEFNAMNSDDVISNNKQKGFGYFGKLQQIMNAEKERRVNFLEVQKGAIDQVETSFFDVEIVSRCLEAKLTICCCLLDKKSKRSEHMESLHNIVVDGEVEDRTIRTIVFNSRMCDNVELDIGKLIRIHAPWEEVRLADSRIVFLSTYFSEIKT